MSKTYRQITYKLRVGRGLGRLDLISVRPCKKDKHGNRVYTDLEKPTLVTFDEHCRLADLDFWLKVGHLVEYKPPVVRKEVKTNVRQASRRS